MKSDREIGARIAIRKIIKDLKLIDSKMRYASYLFRSDAISAQRTLLYNLESLLHELPINDALARSAGEIMDRIYNEWGIPRVRRIGRIELDEDCKEIKYNGETIKLAPMQYRLFSLFLKYPNRFISLREIGEFLGNSKSARKHIYLLRKSLNGHNLGGAIKNKYGFGYILNSEYL